MNNSRFGRKYPFVCPAKKQYKDCTGDQNCTEQLSGDNCCIFISTWWCHQMETFSALLTLCARISPVTKGQWRRALILSLICTWINGWVHTRAAGDLRRHHPHYDVTVMRSGKIYNEDLIRRGTMKPTWHVMQQVMKAHVATCNCHQAIPSSIFSMNISICYLKTWQQCTSHAVSYLGYGNLHN